ncbi:hypothetical protein Snoj_56420 [Streptomyces nojiriensis]|uniref:Uncharacterized protein n=1 Tax=Streptomyces nojiriensis TaxID=66374 RepID=A0ABQ3SUA0_9ACTN|nr:hypothetical protein [Streptomyces nojiriensis]GGR94537.1 hypothetical protein GCM10010205_23950 [Streptomyces nojiriensis]GHI71724.1 hypothetical protein Snoj_56420 [Streptomyces nojiriensis]
MGGGLEERLTLGDGLGDGGADVRDALGDGDGDADFEALGDGEAEGDGLPLLGDGLAEGAAGAALVTGADTFASSSTASLFSVEPGSAHTATAVPLRATAAAAPISSASGLRAAAPVRFSGPPPPPPPPPPPLPYVWPAAGMVRSWTVSAGCDACAGPPGPAGHGPSCGGTGIPYAGVSSDTGAGVGAGTGTGAGSGDTTPDTGCGETGVSGPPGSGNVTYGRMRKGLKPTPGTHPQPAPAAPHSGQC